MDWTDRQTESILLSAADPLGNAEFWLEADDPWQALAVIFEVRRRAASSRMVGVGG